MKRKTRKHYAKYEDPHYPLHERMTRERYGYKRAGHTGRPRYVDLRRNESNPEFRYNAWMPRMTPAERYQLQVRSECAS